MDACSLLDVNSASPGQNKEQDFCMSDVISREETLREMGRGASEGADDFTGCALLSAHTHTHTHRMSFQKQDCSLFTT